MKNKKVFFIVNHDVVIYNFRKELVERLIKLGYEVTILSPKGDRIELLKNLGCKHIEVNVDRHGLNPVKDYKLIKMYKRILLKEKPLVVLTFTIKPNIYGGIAAQSVGISYVANITGLGTALERTGILQKVLISLYKYSFKNVHTVFFQNKDNESFFQKHKIALNKNVLIPGSGVNLKHFYPLKYPTSSKIKFVFISRVMKEKGIEQFLEAAKIIKMKYPSTEFHICGFLEGEYTEILKKYEKDKIIIYHGMIMDIRNILQKVHCTVHPSYYPEGISNVLIESAASARPIITTNHTGCKEVVVEGINGFIVEIKDTNDLVSKIEKFILLSYNEKEKMGIEGRKFVEANYSREIVVNEYMKAISSIGEVN